MEFLKKKGTVKARKKKVTAKEVRENIERIQKALCKIEDTESDEYKRLVAELEKEFEILKRTKTRVTARDIQENIGRIMNAMKLTPEGSEEYERLSKELEHEYIVLKKYKDSKFYIEPKMWATIGGATAVLLFFVCLEREVPSATKFLGTVLRIIPFKG